MTVLSKEQADKILDKAKQPEIQPTAEVAPTKPELDTTVGNSGKTSTAAVDAQQEQARMQNAIIDRAGKFLKADIVEDLKEAIKRNPNVPPSVLGEIVVHLKHSANPGKELMENGVGFSKLVGLVNAGATSAAAKADVKAYESLFPSRTKPEEGTKDSKEANPEPKEPEQGKEKSGSKETVVAKPVDKEKAVSKSPEQVPVKTETPKEQPLPPVVSSTTTQDKTPADPTPTAALERGSVKRSQYDNLLEMDYLRHKERHDDYDIVEFKMDGVFHTVKADRGTPVVVEGATADLDAFDRLLKLAESQETESQDDRKEKDHDEENRDSEYREGRHEKRKGGSIFGDIADVLTEGGDVIDAITGKGRGRNSGGIGNVLGQIGDVIDIFSGDRDDRRDRDNRRYPDRDRDRDRDWGGNRNPQVPELIPNKMGRKEFDRLFDKGLLSQSGPLLESNPPKADFEFRHRGRTYEVTMTLENKVKIEGDKDALDALTEMRERELDIYYGSR
jgi:hypothetical protein